MSGTCWIARVGARPARAEAAAPLTGVDGGPAGWLAAWHAEEAPVEDARRADPRIVDPDGAAGWVSLVWPHAGAFLLFDDGVVQGARRSVLADAEPADLVTTLLVDDRHFAGALTVRRSADAAVRLGEDPFARADRGRTRILRIGAGLLGCVPAPPGPTIERHGSGIPWPGGTF